MTGMEQGLRYIEMEIRFMVRDHFGNPTYTKYADRVILDTCGVSNFCTIVLSSKKPLIAILRAVRGPKGDIIMRFFNASLHDARIEMVMVLAEAAKLAMHRTKASKEAHDYLYKLYRKAIKRTNRLITGGKGKESYKSMYKALRNYASMDDFDLEDDDDEDDGFFGPEDNGDYVDACLSAYREGKVPPEIPVHKPYQFMPTRNMGGNEEILKEIASIEAKIGRPLTDMELEKFLFGDDDDDDDDEDLFAIHQQPIAVSQLFNNSDALDALVDVMYEKLTQRFNKDLQASNTNVEQEETVEEFIDRQIEAKKQAPVKENVVVQSVPLNPTYGITKPSVKEESLEELVEIHNQVRSGSSTTTDSESSTDDENSHLPPDEQSGGKSLDSESDVIDDNNNEGTDVDHSEKTVDLLSQSNLSEYQEHKLLIGDVIRDFDSIDHEIVKTQVSNHLIRAGVNINDISIILTPSDMSNKLLNLLVDIRISGDFEAVNMMYVNMVITMHVKNISKRIGIPEDLIEPVISLTDSNSVRDNNISNVYLALSQIATYIYFRTNEIIDIRFIRNSTNIDIYFLSKVHDTLDKSIIKCINDELQSEDIVKEIFDFYGIDFQLEYRVCEDSTSISNEKFLNDLMNVVSTIDTVNYTNDTELFIKRYLQNVYGEEPEVSVDIDRSISMNNIVFDVIYRVSANYEVSDVIKKELISDLETNAEYRIRAEAILNEISLNIRISPYVTFKVLQSDDDEVIERSSNFGI